MSGMLTTEEYKALANHAENGLAASNFTANVKRAIRVGHNELSR